MVVYPARSILLVREKEEGGGEGCGASDGGKHIGADQCPIVIQGTREREANETWWEKERKRKEPVSNAMLVMETRPYIVYRLGGVLPSFFLWAEG